VTGGLGGTVFETLCQVLLGHNPMHLKRHAARVIRGG
jgi:hypothetical protein